MHLVLVDQEKSLFYSYMMRKFLSFGLLTIGILVFIVNTVLLFRINRINKLRIVNSPTYIKDNNSPEPQKYLINEFTNNDLFDKDVLNVVLLGIDRRSKAEYSFRTDIMILLSVNTKTNKVTLVSIPRDLWYQGQRVNAAFISNGFEDLSNAFYEITGLKASKYILSDFEDFSWIVDAMGGVPVEVVTDFTDVNYPVDSTYEYQTVSFTQGKELLTGERALIYARSRKGTNGEGSDWARMRRQHLILKGMLNAIVQPKSIFNPMNVEEGFELVTKGRMDTNLSLEDAKFLWDMYKDKDKYEIESLFLDSEYVYSPPMEDYGGAWVLVPSDAEYTAFKNALKSKLYNEVITDQNTKDESVSDLDLQ